MNFSSEQGPEGPLPPSEPSPNSRDEGVLRRLGSSSAGKAARAFMLAAMASGVAAPGEARAEEAGINWARIADIAEEQAASAHGSERVRLSEAEWLELARNNPWDTLVNIGDIENAHFAYRVVETAIEANPPVGFMASDHWRHILNADKLLDRLTRTLIDSGQKGAEQVLQSPKKIEHLKKFLSYYREAAERSGDSSVLYAIEPMFQYLPRAFAESIAQNALSRAGTEESLVVITQAPVIRKHLPNADWHIRKAIDQSVEEDPESIFFKMERVLPAVPKNERGPFVERLLRTDPVGAYKYLEMVKVFGPDSGDEFDALVRANTSPEAVILLQILETPDISDTVKRKLPLLLDEFVFNKRFTLEEAAAIVEDDSQMRRLVFEIQKRRNYLGRASIAEFLSHPVTNRIVDASSL